MHISGGWQTKLDCVGRWYRRASNATDPTDRCAYLYAFFENGSIFLTIPGSGQRQDAFDLAKRMLRLWEPLAI